ncbi:MAG: NTP transferase domain-containing protein [Eggerthellales bacterium]|nr:NTP transferase domain-containing protein [Eggerthellales bacterium]
MNTAAIVLAAGEGSRMKSKHSKVTHCILEKPLVRWVVDAAKQAGVEKVITVVGHGRDEVEPLVSDTITVVQEQQLGTANAVAVCKKALEGFEGSLLVLTGDSPLVTADTLSALIRTREENQAAVVVLTMVVDDPFGYGRIVRDANGNVERIVEQKDATPEQQAITECNSGFYCFDAQALFEALEQVKSNNSQGEYYLTDVLEIARNAGRPVLAQVVDDPTECLGVNTRVQLAAAGKKMQQRINTAHMLAGVTMIDPDQVWIGPDVTIGMDTVIYPDVTLSGACAIGQDCVLGPDVHLCDERVEDGSVLSA